MNEFIEHNSPKKIYKKKLSYKILKRNETINRIFKELKSDEWTYGITPDFTNQFEKRFDWGTVDFSVLVTRGFNHFIMLMLIRTNC